MSHLTLGTVQWWVPFPLAFLETIPNNEGHEMTIISHLSALISLIHGNIIYFDYERPAKPGAVFGQFRVE